MENRGGMADLVDDMIARGYDADYDVIKYRTAPRGELYGLREPFTRRGFQTHKVRDEEPMVSEHSGDGGVVQHGLYIVMDAPSASHDATEKTRRKKNLFAVFPKRIGDIVVADHFSFCVDKGDRAKPVHLHMTEYLPLSRDPNMGSVIHLKNYVASSLTVPRDLGAFTVALVSDRYLARWSGLLQTLMLRPYEPSAAVSTTAGGKGGKKAGSAARRRRRAAAAAAARAVGDERTPFEQAWFRLPIRRLLVFGVPLPGDVHHFTVYVYDRMSHPLNGGSKGICFTLASEAAHDEARVNSAIARHLEMYTWDSFVDIKEDEVY